MLKIRNLHLLLALMICPESTVHAGSAAASIQATARVEPSLGLTEVHTVELEPAIAALDFEPGSHLFWLYSPKPSGVTVSIEPLGEAIETISETNELQLLREYSYASLVGLDRELMGPDSLGGDVLITIIYTDN